MVEDVTSELLADVTVTMVTLAADHTQMTPGLCNDVTRQGPSYLGC